MVPVNTKPVAAKPVNMKPVNMKPVNVKPIAAKPVKKSLDVKNVTPSQPMQQPAQEMAPIEGASKWALLKSWWFWAGVVVVVAIGAIVSFLL